MAEGLLTIRDIAKILPGSRGARHVSPSTLTRWILSGCPARDGSRVKLRATRAGTRWLVKESDLNAFFAALAGDAEAEATSPTPPKPEPAQDPRSRTQSAIASLQRRGA